MKLIVVGGTAAGLSAASKAKRTDPSMDVTVYERTGYTSYGACGLPYLVEGKVKEPEDLVTLTPRELSVKRGIRTLIRHEVISLDAASKTLRVRNLETGDIFQDQYDKLVLATGAAAVLPPVAGIDADGVYVLKTVEDGIAVRDRAMSANSAVILGGGLIGLETAEALAARGLQVTVVEALPRLLPYFEDIYAGQAADQLSRHGVSLLTGVSVREVKKKNGCFAACLLSDGREIPADFLLVSAGVRPNTELAWQAGITLGLRGAVRVDEYMRTTDPDIYACGDCAAARHILTGEEVYVPLGTTANKQGKAAGSNIAGEKEVFPGIAGSQVTKVFDLWLAGTGLNMAQAEAAGFEADTVRIQKGSLASYYPGGSMLTLSLVFDTLTGRLLGAQGSGDESIAGRINVLVAAISAGMTVGQLEGLDLVYTPSVAPVYDAVLIAAAQAAKKVRS